MMNQQRLKYAIIFLRTVVALIMLIHGVGRIYLGIVEGFGEFLTINGFPLGFYLAWAITIFEIVGSISLALGFYVAPLAVIFAMHLLCGIYLVHLKDGWFVVGAGRNGAEFSVLLVASFIMLAISHFGKNR
jgi:putative oxidoreductase